MTERLTLRIDRRRVEACLEQTHKALMEEHTDKGYWIGELSTSALSTAVAVSALSLIQSRTAAHGEFGELIDGGVRWIAEHQNEDGGWGDTVISFSNISTTMLCRAALHLTGNDERHPEVMARLGRYLEPFRQRFSAHRYPLAEAIRDRYGKDRTFSVPILMASAIAELIPWSEVPPLPFELACLPQSWFHALRLPVVSYALPALIAIGQAVFENRGTWNPFAWVVRKLSRLRSLRVLEAIQPSNGGFLEATPLTSFVTLGLVSIGQVDHPVVRKSIGFLVTSVRPDGSWPIDTNLSTWVTTLSVNALEGEPLKRLAQLPELTRWLVDQQYREKHPYTGAAPGGWAWTPLPGGVPDADDTPGALLALGRLAEADGVSARVLCEQHGGSSICAGIRWLLDLQNRDGGWPTFCRGWTNLPFDRSGSDLTAHVLRAFAKWERLRPNDELRGLLGTVESSELESARERGLAYLAKEQREDGSWLPLWFGNQHAPDDENPTYGTARVLAAYHDLGILDDSVAKRGIEWITKAQNEDGGWGGGRGTPSSLEETALCLEVLLDSAVDSDMLSRGVDWLLDRIEKGGLHEPTPIGFYFAKLWYFERLYPIIFSRAVLEKLQSRLD